MIDLSAFLRDHLANASIALRPGELTVGLEHEAFAYCEDGSPAPYDATQQLFRAIRGAPVLSHEPQLGQLGVLVDGESGVIDIKYEHPPHLLEIVTPPAADLHALSRALNRGWNELEKAAASCGLVIRHEPLLRVSPSDARVVSPHALPRALRDYRMRRAAEDGRILTPDEQNFSAGLAATQVHVGGLGWHQRTSFVEALYAFEPGMIGLEHVGVGGPVRARDVAHTRWSWYRAAVGGALVGFPDLEAWTLENFFYALRHAPHLEQPPPNHPEAFLVSVRDNQLIKPRLSGTIEFRSSPAQTSADFAIALAALRLGLASYVLENVGRSARDFRSARSDWWEAVLGGPWPDSDHALVCAEAGLRAREKDEDRWLAPLRPVAR